MTTHHPESATKSTPVPTSLFAAERSAEIVADSFAATPDPRLREILGSLVHHLHAFAKDVDLTVDEWAAGIRFLTETGHTCDDTRQEFIMLSDVLGLSMLVETLANPAQDRYTESTVEGPFHMVASPPRALGDSIDEAAAGGEPCLVTGRVTDADGAPVAGASVDVWQADADGFYDVQRPGEVPDRNLRGLFTADDDGRFHFRTIVPRHYPIPTDGPVGGLLRATGRHCYRAAHIHVQVSSPTTRTLTTHLFVADSPYLDSDAVFGVKESLIRTFAEVDDPERAAAHALPNPFRHVDFPVTVQRTGT
ncbi:6-chlorohydroxyquinol-1,2-dioxygenase [Streptomyces sp. SID8379]|uniref:dioxygenase family protein n=1 Tax=unclassified Streptomyces TaxID=2593676 RepID=UPI00037ED006|nr:MULTISPECIES: dioxygenase [unclassified Streptomyces]MYW70072.1 6-chlorohydroxyquinol-1,2-dioxygenase [Streptomyces sp. SID8379]